jgi:hypothetical protein
MRVLFQIVSWLALAATVLPSLLFLGGLLELDQVKTMMLIATVIWFVFTPLWMGRRVAAESSNHAAQSAI